MKIEVESKRRRFSLGLGLHVLMAVAGLMVLFGFPLYPAGFNQGLTAFHWFFSLGMILIFGIGDGHPSLLMKLGGAVVLAVLAAVTITTLILNVSLLIRLFINRKKHWGFRGCLAIGLLGVWGFLGFKGWVSYRGG